MPRIKSLNKFLRTHDWRFKHIKYILKLDPSSINEPDEEQWRPLFHVLRSAKCTRDIVRLLLDCGASIDCRNNDGDTPLLFAFRYCTDEAVITELIERGANVNVQNNYGKSPLCYAFYHRHSKELVEKLLKAGCSIKACKKHRTVWHCFSQYGGYRFESGSSEFMKLLIEAGADVKRVDHEGRSPLCHALFEGAGVEDIKLLFSKGASFSDCKKHDSPVLCVTDGCPGVLLKADIVELLLNKGASVDKVRCQKCIIF